MKTRRILLGILILFSVFNQTVQAQSDKPILNYTLSVMQPTLHRFHMELQAKGLSQDTVVFKMPNWMPGYYQLMQYADNVENISVRNENGEVIPINKINSNTNWEYYSNRKKKVVSLINTLHNPIQVDC